MSSFGQENSHEGQTRGTDPVVILGAGPAGLSCAYRILRGCGRKVLVIEKAPFVGGAGASFKWKGHTLDFGPHAFHTRGDEPEQLVRSLFNGAPDILIEGRKQVHVYLKGKRFKYPLQVGETLLKFNPFLSIRIVCEFLLTSLFHAIVSIPVENFEDWGRKRFGGTLYKMSFGDYTEKVWKTKAHRISAKFASEKIQGFNFVNLIKRLLRIGGQVTEPYYQTWIYHKYGSGQLYAKLADEIRSLGGEILLNREIKSINTRGRGIVSVTLAQNGICRELPCSSLVNTIPLPKLIALFGDIVPFTVRNSASKLKYISLIIVYLEFAMEKVSDDHWFYLLDKKFKFNRVTEQKNLSRFTVDPGKTVLSLELTCRVGDHLWQLSDRQLFELATEECKNIDFIQLNRVTDFMVKRVLNVYEIYYRNFDQHADLLLSYLKEFKNIVSIGRRGLFLQGDMHQAVEMGLKMGKILEKNELDRAAIEEFYRKYVRYLDGE